VWQVESKFTIFQRHLLNYSQTFKALENSRSSSPNCQRLWKTARALWHWFSLAPTASSAGFYWSNCKEISTPSPYLSMPLWRFLGRRLRGDTSPKQRLILLSSLKSREFSCSKYTATERLQTNKKERSMPSSTSARKSPTADSQADRLLCCKVTSYHTG